MISLAEIESEFAEAIAESAHRLGRGPLWPTPLLREDTAIGVIIIRRTEVRPFYRKADRSAQNFRRSSRDRDRERATVQGTRRSATQSCARHWSIRPQPPRCSASSAARRRTCSRSWTPSSRAPRGFVGSMTWCCDSARGDAMVPRAHFGLHTHSPRRDQHR